MKAVHALFFIVCFLGFHSIRGARAQATRELGQIEWGRSYINGRAHKKPNGPAIMVDVSRHITFSWSFACKDAKIIVSSCQQESATLQVFRVGPIQNESSIALNVTLDGTETRYNWSDDSNNLSVASRYAWRVGVVHRMNQIRSSAVVWSLNHTFFTSLNAWRAKPIWASKENGSSDIPKYALLRANYTIPKDAQITSALVYVTAQPPLPDHGTSSGSKILAGYKLWVNDRLVGLGPGRSRCGPIACANGELEMMYDGFDISPVIASMHAGQSISFFAVCYGEEQKKYNIVPGMMAEVHLTFDDGSVKVIQTCADSWRAMDGDSVYNPGDDSGCAWYSYPQENFNASAVPSGTPISNLKAPGQSDPRPQEVLHESWTRPLELPAFDLPLVAKPTPPIAVNMLGADAISVVPINGNPGAYFFDLGKNVQGGIKLTIKSPLDSVLTARVRLAEELTNASATPAAGNQRIYWPPRTGLHNEVSWSFAIQTHSQAITHHEYNEFRYGEISFQFSNSSLPGSINLKDFAVEAWVVTLPFDSSSFASMNSSNPLLDQVWNLCQYTIEASTLDLYSDSNARQRSPDCDADDITAMKSQYATTDQLILQRFATEQLIASGPASRIDWSVLPIIAVYEYTLHSGDLTLARDTFDTLLANHSRLDTLKSVRGDGTEGALLSYVPDSPKSKSHSSLVDWPPGMQDGYVFSSYSTITSSHVYYGSIFLAEIAKMINRTSDEQDLRSTASKIRNGINQMMWNGTAYCDGTCANTSHTAFHSTIYALAFGIADDDKVDPAFEYVVGRINSEADEKFLREPSSRILESTESSWPPPEPSSGVGLPCGTYPSQFAVRALYAKASDMGSAALAVLTSDYTNSWIQMLKQGATMTMEMWNA